MPMALYKHVGKQGRAPRRHGRHRLRRDGVSFQRRGLEVGTETPGDLGARGAQAPQLGDRTDGVTAPRAGQPATPQRDDGLPARGGLVLRDGGPRLLAPGRLHLRFRPAGDEILDSTTRAKRRRSRAAQSGDGSARSTTIRISPRSSQGFPSPDTTTPTSSRGGSISSSTESTACPGRRDDWRTVASVSGPLLSAGCASPFPASSVVAGTGPGSTGPRARRPHPRSHGGPGPRSGDGRD